jgi:hypothetical protein
MTRIPDPDPASDPEPHDRWESEGGAVGPPSIPSSKRLAKVDAITILEILDYIASHSPGFSRGSRLAASLAAAIRVRGI